MKHSKMTMLELLNDLIAVNAQRIWSYEALLEGPADDSDEELIMVFEQIIVQGQRLREELEREFVQLTSELPAGSNLEGTILRAWNVVKSLFADKKPALPIRKFFDTGERAVLKAYRYAEKQIDTPPSIKKLITKQKRELSFFYDRYKHLYREQFV